MELKLGIPNDTPENTIRAIIEILEDEASRCGGVVEKDINGGSDISIHVGIRIRRVSKSFDIDLFYVKYENVGRARGFIGTGVILPDWDLALLHGEDSPPHWWGWNPGEANPQPPFRWGLYPNNSGGALASKPHLILDGSLLRRLIRESLGLERPELT
jgi:hypothetical protein